MQITALKKTFATAGLFILLPLITAGRAIAQDNLSNPSHPGNIGNPFNPISPYNPYSPSNPNSPSNIARRNAASDPDATTQDGAGEPHTLDPRKSPVNFAFFAASMIALGIVVYPEIRDWIKYGPRR